ncbi:MAG: hypothetical protein D6719_04335, partial [Candidatus Dadabacteria bacterium]
AMNSNMDEFKKLIGESIQIQSYIDNVLAKDLKVDEKEIKETFSSNPEKYKKPEEVRARHILIKVPENASAEQEKAAKEKIEAIYREVTKKGADFAAIATTKSEGPSASRGGDLGFFSKGMMVPTFENAAFKLKKGEISKPVRTRFGYHIIQVIDRHKAKEPNLKEAHDQIKKELLQGKKQSILMTKLQELKREAKIDIKLPELKAPTKQAGSKAAANKAG